MGFNNTYRNKVIAYTKGLITDARVGSDDTNFSKTDTSLGTLISGTENSTTNTDIQNGINVEYTLLEGQGNGEVVKEIEFIMNDNTQLLREVLPDTTKTSDIQVTVAFNGFVDINDEWNIRHLLSTMNNYIQWRIIQ